MPTPAVPHDLSAVRARLAARARELGFSAIGITGIELAVSRLEGKFKLSQNRPAADRPRIIAALEHREDADSWEMARLMREREGAG